MRPRGAFVVSFCHFHKIINELLMTEIKARVKRVKGGRKAEESRDWQSKKEGESRDWVRERESERLLLSSNFGENGCQTRSAASPPPFAALPQGWYQQKHTPIHADSIYVCVSVRERESSLAKKNKTFALPAILLLHFRGLLQPLPRATPRVTPSWSCSTHN